MAEYSRLASGQVVSTGGATAVRIPFIPDFIEISNKDSAQEGLGVYRAWWMTDMGQGSAFLETAGASSGGNYGYTYALTPQSVAVEAPVIWDSQGPSVGVVNVAASPNITVTNAGTYEFVFSVSGTEPNQFALFVNGVAQTSTVYGSGAGTQQNTGVAILTVPAGAVITLVNHTSAAAVTLASLVGGNGSIQPNVTASVTISQIGSGVGNGVGYIDVIGGTSSAGLVNGTGFKTVQAGLALQYGPQVLLGGSGGIAKTGATTLTITTTAAHNLTPGNWVIFQNLYQTSTTGMQTLAGIPFEVLTVTPTTFTIGWVGNAANLTAIVAGGLNALASFKEILYPVLYAPGVAFPWTITQSSNVVTVNTTAPHNFVIGQEIAFRIPPIYGATEINSLPDLLIPGSPVYYYVVSVPTATSFTFNYSGPLTAFSVANPAFLSFPGLKFAQVVAMGDINSGGWPYTGGDLYPSPLVYDGTGLSPVRTINGPAIQGAYINNTWMGFIIGSGVSGDGPGEGPGDTLYWRAYMSDKNYP